MLRRLACSLLVVTLCSGIAAARPYRFEDDLVKPDISFAQPPEDATDRIAVVDRAQVKAALAARRKQNLALFTAYRTAGVYPHNFVQDGKLNVWLDDEGRLCAAATLIASSGNRDLAMSVPSTDNFIRLADVTDGALMDWILTSGFTQAEIAAIQEPFMGRMQPIQEQPDAQRLAEDQRLAKKYAQVERQLIKARKKSLDRAVDRLMQHPDLAAQLVATAI
jgi:hypothetical protein